LDGFRGLLSRTSEGVARVFSRNTRDLAPWFPELVGAASTLPPATVLDGEIVIANEQGCPDFTALQNRLATARKHTHQAAAERPALLVAFDLLALPGHDLTEEPLDGRRAQLEGLLSASHPCLQLVLQTADVETAREWLRLLPTIEGVVAKRGDGRYGIARRREWVKVKRYRTVDCVVIGLAGDSDAPKLVLALRHSDNLLHHLRVTGVIPHASTAPIVGLLDRAGPVEAAIPSPWQHDAVPPWRHVPPELVCEVRTGAINLLVGRHVQVPASSKDVCQ
jgi:ATP-dependent DNA ligase